MEIVILKGTQVMYIQEANELRLHIHRPLSKRELQALALQVHTECKVYDVEQLRLVFEGDKYFVWLRQAFWLLSVPRIKSLHLPAQLCFSVDVLLNHSLLGSFATAVFNLLLPQQVTTDVLLPERQHWRSLGVEI